MENYLVSARKYRPSTFASVVGQKALAATLKNSVGTNRLAHAYLFCGSRGVGKTSCARIFAKTINCEHPTADGEACNECDSCRAFNEGRSMNIIELDAASNNGVDQMRSLVEQVLVPPSNGRYRVFIIDEVHMLSTAAFNSFLKTLEEPPSYVVFILATTEKHKIIPTILSRCQIYDFNRITVNDIVDHLSYVARCEGIEFEPAALTVIARKADGAMRDALSIFDQVAASSMGKITYTSTIANLNVLDSDYYSRLMKAFAANDVADALLTYKEIRDHGFDSHFFINGLADHLRDLMVARDEKTMSLLEVPDDERRQLAEQAAGFTPEFLWRAMSLCNDADLNYRMATNKQFLVELTLIKLCQADSPFLNDNDSDGGEGQLQKIVISPQETATDVTATKPDAAATAPTPKPTPLPAPNDQRPATATEPVRTPAASTAGTPHRQRRTASRLGLSISGTTTDTTSTTTSSENHDSPTPTAAYIPKRAGVYSDADMAREWSNFIQENQQEKALIKTMEVCPPKQTGKDEFRVDVESPAQQQAIETNIASLLAFLRDRLSNDYISINVKIIEGQGSARTWTEREIFAHLLEKNETLRRMNADLKFTLD